jgi:hypothetical protein
MVSICIGCIFGKADRGFAKNGAVRNKTDCHVMRRHLIRESFPRLQPMIQSVGTRQAGFRESLNISGRRNTNAEVRLGTQHAEQRHHQ